jgi:hypothetical protein
MEEKVADSGDKVEKAEMAEHDVSRGKSQSEKPGTQEAELN